ncbi:unnamed protein product, partial [Mesorhabditis belari]|uniref:VWFA domain-containing protein n=1 Tax=Mesorhabditis belari TaxID=2138241 RepID=A0AAF3EGV2_9BILA
MLTFSLFIFFFFLNKPTNAVDICPVLFVIDGSDYYPTFRSEIIAISSTASIAYQSSSTRFEANFWMYGSGNDGAIPSTFMESANDFKDHLQELQSAGGKESVAGATSQLNSWSTRDALIVIYTARTIAIHLNDGIDTSPISAYPSPAMADYNGLVSLMFSACKNLTSPVTTPTPQCRAYFAFDGSDAGKAFGNQQKEAAIAAGRKIYSSMDFYPNAWMYTDQSTDKDLPYAIITNQDLFESTVNSMQFTGGSDTVVDAVKRMNDPRLYSWPLMVLFTGSDQSSIDKASSIYIRRNFTIGVGLSGQTMSSISALSATFANLPDALLSLCQNPPPYPGSL